MRSLIAVLKSIMNVEKEAYISNHYDAEPMFINEEEKRPTIGDLMVCLCVCVNVKCEMDRKWLFALYLQGCC